MTNDACHRCDEEDCVCGSSVEKEMDEWYNRPMTIDDPSTRSCYRPPAKPPVSPEQHERAAEAIKKMFVDATGDADIDDMLRECVRLLEVKGQDYTVGRNDVDRLYNFREGAAMVGIRPDQVWWTYFWKHLTAVQRYVKDGKVDSEGIEGRIVDCVNYLALLFKIVRERGRGNI